MSLDLNDEIVASTLVTRNGDIVNPRVREFYSLPVLAGALLGEGMPSDFISNLLVFIPPASSDLK